MTNSYIIGIDYGSESARGVLLDALTGNQLDGHIHAYRHGIMSNKLGAQILPRGWALQDAMDYVEAARDILSRLGCRRRIFSIGIGFTASSPLPTTETGVPLSEIYPDEPHAYVKLWKHVAAQPYADVINRRGGSFLKNFGGKVSGEWLFPKAAQIAEVAPEIWAGTDRFIEAGDWLVWQLTGSETRSLSFAAFKAQYTVDAGYPQGLVPGIERRLSLAHPAGTNAGHLSAAWSTLTEIEGPTAVAIAIIDSHVVLPAINAVSSGCFVGALGTSAGYLYLNSEYRAPPPGIEGVAIDGSLPGLWCYEAGQASFGDMLRWYVTAFPLGASIQESFHQYNEFASQLEAGANHLIAVDWWNGNRVPLADSTLSGILVGLSMETTSVGIYRALLESLCYGARTILDLYRNADFTIERVLMTSGLAERNPLLVQIMADVMERTIEVPKIEYPTAVGAAIHGAVASSLVPDFRTGAARFGAREFKSYFTRKESHPTYRALYERYRALCEDRSLRQVARQLNDIVVDPNAAVHGV